MDEDDANGNSSSQDGTEDQEQYDPIVTTTPSVYVATQQPNRSEEPYIVGSLYQPSGSMLVLPPPRQHVEPNNQLFRKPHFKTVWPSTDNGS